MAGNAQPVYDGTDGQFVGNAAIASLTDNTGGTANDTLVAISATYTQAEVRDNLADLAAKVNAILAALRASNIISG